MSLPASLARMWPCPLTASTACRKEKLWPHIREFADRAIAHTRRTSIALSEAGTPCELYAVHGHYADAGEVAALMSSTLGIDMVMTGHSLGRNKLEHLLGELQPEAVTKSKAAWQALGP